MLETIGETSRNYGRLVETRGETGRLVETRADW